MSKFIPDPQIQSLRAMRAGDIAIANPSPLVMTIGKSSVAFVQPLIQLSRVVPPAVPSLVALSGTPSESPVISRSFTTTLTQNVFKSVSVSAVNALEALAGTPSEAPTVGVAFTTSVI